MIFAHRVISTSFCSDFIEIQNSEYNWKAQRKKSKSNNPMLYRSNEAQNVDWNDRNIEKSTTIKHCAYIECSRKTVCSIELLSDSGKWIWIQHQNEALINVISFVILSLAMIWSALYGISPACEMVLS